MSSVMYSGLEAVLRDSVCGGNVCSKGKSDIPL